MSGQAAKLLTLLQSPQITFMMEAHDGLSARVVEATGFGVIWASGLTISSRFGLRDLNEMSSRHMLDAVECIVGAANLPILVDGDSGYGDFNTARLFAQSLLRRGAAGVCYEDKVFPKQNSFLPGRHDLAAVDEFSGVIRAAKDLVEDELVVVARTEAFISGQSTEVAVSRAEAYVRAGADAVFVHSKRADAEEIASFMASWSSSVPVIIAPTTYYRVPVETFRQLGVYNIVWANQTMRAGLQAMVDICARIRSDESVSGVEPSLASISNLFDLLDYKEYEQARLAYGHFERPNDYGPRALRAAR